MKGRIRHRMTIFLLGIFISLVVLEISLRVVGSIYAGLSESDYGEKKNSAETILCVGDSFTFGIGATREQSYPAQLQKMLDEADPKQQINVVNRGWPGQNSARLLIRLKEYLQEFKPKVVAVLIGTNNKANFFGYREYLEEVNNKQNRLFLRLHNMLDTIRLYKFVRFVFEKKDIQKSKNRSVESPVGSEEAIDYLGEHTKEFTLYGDGADRGEKTPQCIAAWEQRRKGNYDKALALILDVVERKDVESECYYIGGSIYRERKRYDEARVWFRKGVKRDPGLFNNYEGIGETYRDQNKLNEALVWFKKGFSKARPESLHKLCYIGINVAFEDTGDIKGAIAFFEKEAQRSLPEGHYLLTLANDYLAMFKKNRIDAEVLSWLESDLNKIVNLCRRNNARIILQNYPAEPMVNFVFNKVSQEQDVLFVDHQKTFAQFVQNGVLSSEFFIADGHPNSRGYRLMAENVLKVLQKIPARSEGER